MNNPTPSRTLASLRLVAGLTAASLLLSACGGDDKKKTETPISSSSSSHSYSAPTIPDNGTGTWPSVKARAVAPKTLQFEWNAVAGATHYQLLKNADGNSGFVPVGAPVTAPMAQDVIGVHLHDWLNATYMVDACNADGCFETSAATFTATEMLGSIGYLKASNPGFADWFGWSIALSGDASTLAVSAPAEDSGATGIDGDQALDNATNAGAVYIFTRDSAGLWVQEAYVKASNTEQPLSPTGAKGLVNDRFGYAVSLSHDGNTLAVSALLEDSPSWGVNCNQDNYEITTSVAPPLTSAEALSSASSSVTLDQTSQSSSSTGVIAADFNVGAVYVFERSATTWSQTAYFKPYYPASELQFGNAITLSGDGNTLAVGAKNDGIRRGDIQNFYADIQDNVTSARSCFDYYASRSSVSSTSSSSSSTSSVNTSLGGVQSGAVYTFRKLDGQWHEDAFIKAANAGAGDAFGAALALTHDGSVLAVGAPLEDSSRAGVNPAGVDENRCAKLADDVITDIKCGYNGTPIDTGAAYLFARTDARWAQTTYVKPEAWTLQSRFGEALAISGDASTLAVGAPGDGAVATGVNAAPAPQQYSRRNLGAIWVYSQSSGVWAREAFIKPEADGRGIYFGQALALSFDGAVLASGSYTDASLSQGVNGDSGNLDGEGSGAVHVFTRTSGEWQKRAYVKAPNAEKHDRFGRAISLSDDGETMAVGAQRESGKGDDQADNTLEASGAAYVY